LADLRVVWVDGSGGFPGIHDPHNPQIGRDYKKNNTSQNYNHFYY